MNQLSLCVLSHSIFEYFVGFEFVF
jgi:hypothetical protein